MRGTPTINWLDTFAITNHNTMEGGGFVSGRGKQEPEKKS
jgi:hypothetical protein